MVEPLPEKTVHQDSRPGSSLNSLQRPTADGTPVRVGCRLGCWGGDCEKAELSETHGLFLLSVESDRCALPTKCASVTLLIKKEKGKQSFSDPFHTSHVKM